MESAHYEGKLYVDKALKDKVQTTYAENIPENAEAERIMEKMIAQGNKLIFATGYGYFESALLVAAHHPEVIIMHCGTRAHPQSITNVGTYFAKQYQAAYVVGMVAGCMTKKNTVGCVGGHPIPQVIAKVDAFTMGVQSGNPKATVREIWTNSWSDPPTEAEAVQSLIEQGADVIASSDIDSPVTVIRKAEKQHIYSVSYSSNIKSLAPDGCLVSAYWNWGPLYAKIAQSVIDGSWKASDNRYSLKDGYIKLSSFGPAVPKAVQQQAIDLFQKIAANKISVFKGPIKDRDGVVRIPAGKIPDDNYLGKIDWLVPGIETNIPKK